MFVGFAFKVSAAPFQIWAPDVYQGAPAPVSAFMSAGPKAAAFAVFVRVFMTAFSPIIYRWEPFVWSSALLTMVVGNFAALMQTNIKRLLAYSSIAHAGYIMVAIAAHNEIGISAVMFYLAAYALMNIGAFAVVAYFSRQGEKYVDVDDLAGLGWKQPVPRRCSTIFCCPHRCTAHRRILRQVLYLPRRVGRQSGLAGDSRLAQQRGGRLLLSPDSGCDVHAGARRIARHPATGRPGNFAYALDRGLGNAVSWNLPLHHPRLRSQLQRIDQIRRPLTIRA